MRRVSPHAQANHVQRTTTHLSEADESPSTSAVVRSARRERTFTSWFRRTFGRDFALSTYVLRSRFAGLAHQHSLRPSSFVSTCYLDCSRIVERIGEAGAIGDAELLPAVAVRILDEMRVWQVLYAWSSICRR